MSGCAESQNCNPIGRAEHLSLSYGVEAYSLPPEAPMSDGMIPKCFAPDSKLGTYFVLLVLFDVATLRLRGLSDFLNRHAALFSLR